jgi:hypothetical protein
MHAQELLRSTPFPSADASVRFDALNVRRDWGWVSSKLQCHLVEDTGGIIAIDRHGDYAGAIVFDSFTETACCCHVLVEQPLIIRHGFLNLAARAVFVNAKRHVIIGMTPANNEKALVFNRRIGWKEVYRVRDGYAFGIDYVVHEMRREECRWLSKEERHDG